MNDDMLQKLKDDLMPKYHKNGQLPSDSPYNPDFNRYAARIVIRTTVFTDEAKHAMWGIYWGLRS